MLGAAETGLITLACGVEGWLMSLVGFQDGSGCRMGTAQAGLVELEDGWWPRSVSPPAPSLRALGQPGALRPQHGLWGRIALEGRVLAPLSYGGKCSSFDLLCQIAPLQQESKRWTRLVNFYVKLLVSSGSVGLAGRGRNRGLYLVLHV